MFIRFFIGFLKVCAALVMIGIVLIALVAGGFYIWFTWDHWDIGLHASHPPILPSCAASESIMLVPPEHGMYYTNYIGGGDVLRSFSYSGPGFYRRVIPQFEQLAGKKLTIVPILGFSTRGEITFPTRQAKAIWDNGAIPAVGITPMSWNFSDEQNTTYFALQRFIDGAFDQELTAWLLEAKATDIPLLASFGGETTAGWPWSGHYHGAGTRDGYGDPTYPDGPERYRDAYRHIIDLARGLGVTNISWGYGTAKILVPEGTDAYEEYYGDWNHDRFYYPGDEYIDWIGAGVWGYYYPYFPEWKPFRAEMDALYSQLSKISDRAWFAIEMGVQHDPSKGDMAAWIRDAYADLASGRYPRVKSISWWHEYNEDSETGATYHTAIDVTPEVLQAFRESVADPFFVEQPRFACVASTL